MKKLLIGVVALAAVIAGGLFFLNTSIAPQEGVDSNSIPEGWVEYRSEDLGLLFLYPSEWGEVKVEIETDPGDPETQAVFGPIQGSFLFGAFTEKNNVSFGGPAVDYDNPWPRGPGLLESPGFIERDGSYYESEFHSQPIKNSVLESTVNTQALIIRELDNELHGPHVRAELNLTSPEYEGVTFVRSFSREEKQMIFSSTEEKQVLEQVISEFLEVIKTIELVGS